MASSAQVAGKTSALLPQKFRISKKFSIIKLDPDVYFIAHDTQGKKKG